MSDFDEKMMQKMKLLEREVERLQRWERPIGGGGGVTDHGALTGLADDDHPQYLLTTGKAADSDKLDGNDSTYFSPTTHNHDHGSLTGLGDNDHPQYVNTSSSQTVGGVKTFTSFPVTPSSAPAADYQVANKKYVDDSGGGGVTDHGALTGLADDDHPQYLLTTGKAADSDRLDGIDSTGFVDILTNQEIDGVKSFLEYMETSNILPLLSDTYDVGSATRRFRAGFFSELSTLIFRKENVVILDGQFLITKMAGALPAQTGLGTPINFGRTMYPGDFVLFRSEGQMEYMQVGSLVSGTTYQVTRNLDGTGANNWPEGEPFAVLGSAGEGWLELNALDKRRMSVWSQGSAYNNSLEIARYGEITGWQNAGFSGIGLAFGDFSNDKYFVSTDVDGMVAVGLSLKIGSGEKDVDLTGIQIDDTEIVGQADGVDQVVIGADGKLTAGQGDVVLDENGITLNAPIGSDTYDSKKSLSFMMMDTDTLVGYLSGYKGDVNEAYANILRTWAVGCSPVYRSELNLTTYNGDASNQKISNITIESTSTNTRIQFNADSCWTIGNFNVTNGGLYIGNTTDPGDNNLVVDGTIKDGDGNLYGRPVFLTTQLTSTAWDGDAYSTTAKTLIDLSSVFSVPAGVNAVIVNAAVRDSGSAAAANALLCLSPTNSSLAGPKISCAGLPNDVWAYGSFIVPCNSNGDIYYQIVASGTGTMDAYLEIWGYFL